MIETESAAEIRRHLAAAPERVFAAFADARWVAAWLKPAPEVQLDVLEFDFRETGAYRFAYRPPGQETVVIGGVYRLIERPGKIVFSWIIEPPDPHAGIESEVTVTIRPDGSGSEIVVRHVRLDLPGAPARHEEGWRGALALLDAFLRAVPSELP